MDKQIAYKYTSIYLLWSRVAEPEIDDIGEAISNQKINIRTETAFDTENNFCFIDLTIIVNSSIDKVELINVKLRNSFEIKGINAQDIENKENKELFTTLASLSYSTSRGYLAATLSNYRFKEKIFLPVIDPSKLLENSGKKKEAPKKEIKEAKVSKKTKP